MPDLKFKNIKNLEKKESLSITVRFNNYEDFQAFERLLDEPLNSKNYIFTPRRKLRGFAIGNRKKTLQNVHELKERDTKEFTDYWWGLPEYRNCLAANKCIQVSFLNLEDKAEFVALVQPHLLANQKITKKSQYFWFPYINRQSGNNFFTGDGLPEHEHKYPIYVPSKGRAAINKTPQLLEKMNANFYVIVEEQEYEDYLQTVKKERLLILPPKYKEEYNTCDDIPHANCSGPARNFGWDHSISMGYEMHWMMDDNIAYFYMYQDNNFYRVHTSTFFRVMEDFCDRFENFGMGGPNYQYFTPRNEKRPPFVFNTRLFSCNLIRNDLPFRWRARYNEDADLSINILKDGYLTIQFYQMLQGKLSTGQMKGGNQDIVYKDGTKEKSEMLFRLHPDCVALSVKFGRHHHSIQYEKIKNKAIPIYKEGITDPDEFYSDDYGLIYHDFWEIPKWKNNPRYFKHLPAEIQKEVLEAQEGKNAE